MLVKRWILRKHFEGLPKENDLELTYMELNEDLKANEILLEALYLSVDPYMRQYSKNFKLPKTMFGEQVSRVIKSNNPHYPIGTEVLSNAGWVSHYVSTGEDLKLIPLDLGDTCSSQCIGALGVPGAAAYFGLEKLQPKKGQILILNSAAGAVGSIVGQLAKIKGCTVIAFTSTDKKVEWCKELGFDHVFNYTQVDFSQAISKVAPKGAHMFFDNVGGEYYHKIVNNHLREHGKVLVCGSISEYNNTKADIKFSPPTNGAILRKELIVQGLKVTSYKRDWITALVELHFYIKSGKIKTKETVYEGIDEMRNAFIGLFNGRNIGKTLVRNKLNVLYL